MRWQVRQGVQDLIPAQDSREATNTGATHDPLTNRLSTRMHFLLNKFS